MNHTNQHRFILESKERVTIKYQVDFTDPDEPEIVFDDFIFTDTSNQLNRFIGLYLNKQNEQIVNTVGSHSIVLSIVLWLEISFEKFLYNCSEFIKKFKSH